MSKGANVKEQWGALYKNVPPQALERVLVRGDDFDRIGPIELPMLTPQHGVVHFTLYYFGFYESGESYFLITRSKDLQFTNPLVRVSSNCNWAFDLDSVRCECNWELQHAKAKLAVEPDADGLIIFALDQHGKSIPGGTRGHALIYALGQAQGQDLVREAYINNGFALDYRKYDDVNAILRAVGVRRMRLMTNNPERIEYFRAQGFETERESVEKPYEPHDAEELGVKKEKLGHMLDLPSFHKEDVRLYGLDPTRVFS
jgi:GTP cyclohydrolase II